jgi:ABC-type transporter Mla MlaB component
MLKITVVDGDAEHKLLVEGRLVATCVSELERVWNEARRLRRSSRIVIDLSGTTDIDTSGKAMLVAMVREGARLTAHGIYSKYVAEELMTQARQGGSSRRKQDKGISVESNSAGSLSSAQDKHGVSRRAKLCATPDEPDC